MKNSKELTNLLDVTDEKEFKLWVKFILSVHQKGGNTEKPVDILWKSVKYLIDKKK
jgi:hypothetical protein